jgi:hypothetical protein
MKKLVLILMLVNSLFGESTWSAFGYTVNQELIPKKLQIVKKDCASTCYKIKHKPVGDLTKFQVCTATHGKKIIREIIAESKMLKTNSECMKKYRKLEVAIKNKYGKASNKWGAVKTKNIKLAGDCATIFTKDMQSVQGYKVKYKLRDYRAIDYAKDTCKKWKNDEAAKGALEYNGL